MLLTTNVVPKSMEIASETRLMLELTVVIESPACHGAKLSIARAAQSCYELYGRQVVGVTNAKA